MDVQVRTALVSVYDKTGVVEFCRRLAALGVDFVSSGGTARVLTDAGLSVTSVSDLTGYPEMLGGRVKTLHPAVHAGILAVRHNGEHMKALGEAGLQPIDLVVVNLYPFERTAADATATLPQIIEMIDIGGPAMVRAAAKNHDSVGVLVSPADYDAVATRLEATRTLDRPLRRRLARAAFRHTASYDAEIVRYLDREFGEADEDGAEAPSRFEIGFDHALDLRYGENPHQSAAFYRDPSDPGPSLASAEQLKGKPLSFNNILDLDAALALAAELPSAGCAILKHGNPCGVALGAPAEAFERALACDPVSAFGGVIAWNGPVDADATRLVAEGFYEGLLAPSFGDEALAALRKKKSLRILATGPLDAFHRRGRDLRRVTGGLLVQDWDPRPGSVRDGEVATDRAPTDDEWRALDFAWVVAKHVKSNAIVYSDAEATIGIGAGQMSRVDSARFGAEKARRPLEGCAMASDAFFPFRDGIDAAAERGVSAVVQPGGSVRDDEVIAAANEHGMAMVFTGRRHFRH